MIKIFNLMSYFIILALALSGVAEARYFSPEQGRFISRDMNSGIDTSLGTSTSRFAELGQPPCLQLFPRWTVGPNQPSRNDR